MASFSTSREHNQSRLSISRSQYNIGYPDYSAIFFSSVMLGLHFNPVSVYETTKLMKQVEIPTSTVLSQKERRRLRAEYLRFKKSKALQDSSSDASSSDLSSQLPDVDSLIGPSRKRSVQDDDIDIRKEMRKIRNRESAEASRKRKKDDIRTLQDQVNSLLDVIDNLKSRLEKYENVENSNEAMLENFASDKLILLGPAVFKYLTT